MTERAMTRTLRERTTYLKLLIASVDRHLGQMDGYAISYRAAKSCIALDMANQHAKRFGLPTRKGKAR